MSFIDMYKEMFTEYANMCRSIGIVPKDIFDDWKEHYEYLKGWLQ